jgi:hypothetical protein
VLLRKPVVVETMRKGGGRSNSRASEFAAMEPEKVLAAMTAQRARASRTAWQLQYDYRALV